LDIIIYSSALFIGILLGLIGGGGSIVTLPVFVYLLGINPVLSTAYSLFVVGSAALVGAGNNYFKGFVSLKTAIIFAIPSLITVYLTRLYLLPIIPENILSIGQFNLLKGNAIMIFFAIIMLLAAYSMLKPKKENEEELEAEQISNYPYPLIIAEGGVIGLLTGLVGAGGGFLIIPALVLLAKLPMKLAIGTSLLIIAIKSFVGFMGDIQAGQFIDWSLLLKFTSFSIIGIFIGGYFSNYITSEKLKKTFGIFVLLMAIFILTKETILK